MSTAKSFEELMAWQKARELTKLIYGYAKKENLRTDFGLVDQICRAAVSVMSNIAEGFERGSREEIIYFLYIAKASCGEVRAQLYVALDQGYISRDEFQRAVELAKYVSALIFKFIDSLKVSKYKGLKFKKISGPDDEVDLEIKRVMDKIKKSPLNFSKVND